MPKSRLFRVCLDIIHFGIKYKVIVLINNKIYQYLCIFSSQKFLVKQSSTPFGKFCISALTIAINMPFTIFQLPIRQFCSFGKKNVVECRAIVWQNKNFATVQILP